MERAIGVLALLGIVAKLGFSAIQRGGWPLVVTPEVIIASAAAAILWHLLDRRGSELKLDAVIFYAIVAGLLIWGFARRPAPQAASVGDSGQQTWLFVSHLALVLACGAFVEASSLALASLLTERQTNKQADMDSTESAGRCTVLLGLSLLTASLLLAAVGAQYTRGVYWNWSVSESWQLVVWLFYTTLWCAFTLSGRSWQRLRGLTALGLFLSLLIFIAMER